LSVDMNVKRHTSSAKSSSDSWDNIRTKNKRANIKRAIKKQKSHKRWQYLQSTCIHQCPIVLLTTSSLPSPFTFIL